MFFNRPMDAQSRALYQNWEWAAFVGLPGTGRISFFKLDGLVEMVTRRVSEDFNGFLANASGYQNTQFQKLICPAVGGDTLARHPKADTRNSSADTQTTCPIQCHAHRGIRFQLVISLNTSSPGKQANPHRNIRFQLAPHPAINKSNGLFTGRSGSNNTCV